MASLSSSNVLYIGQSGSWPTETYTTYLCADVISPLVSFYQSENYYSFLRNSTIDTKSINTVAYNSISSTYFNTQKAFGLFVTTDSSNFVWYPSSFRLNYNAGPQFNYFYVNYTPETDILYANYAGYLLYPSRSIILPLTLVKESDGWVLNTSSVLIKPQIYYFDTKTPEIEAVLQHTKVLNLLPEFSPLPSSSNISIVYDLSASYQRSNSPLITYDDSPPGFPLSRSQTPIIKSRILDADYVSIRPESTFFSYSLGFVPQNNLPKEIGTDFSFTPIINPYPGESVVGFRGFKSPYYTNLKDLSANKLYFNLIQDPPNYVDQINYFNSEYTIFNATLSLSSSVIQLSCKNFLGEDGNVYSAISGTPFSFVGLSYIGDAEFFLNGESSVFSLISFKINNSSKNLNVPEASTIISPLSASWKTSYPPHYYSYKSSVIAPSLNINKKSDSSYLNFELKLSSFKINSSAILITPYFGSEYDYLTYSLSANSLDSESFKLKVINPGKWNVAEIMGLNVIECFYGNNLDIPYNLATEQYIPAVSASRILVTYPNTPYGEINLTLKGSLTSDLGIIETPAYSIINFASGSKQTSKGTPIFLEKISDEQGVMVVTCSHLTADPGFPTRDLTNSIISWSFTPDFLPVKMTTLDLSGNEIEEISPDTVLTFGENTHTVKFSNLGLNTITAQLSSYKYEETASLQNDPSIFNPFKERKFYIDLASPLNNLNRTRTLSLSAGVMFEDQVYSIPPNTKICWKWKYNNTYDPNFTPIKAYYGSNNTPYVYGSSLDATSLSSLYLEITPNESEIPSYIPVSVYIENLSVDPLIRTSYSFVLDSFPTRKILNTDFTITYADYISSNFIDNPATVCNTFNNIFSVIRPATSTNTFYLEKPTDLGAIASNLNSTYVWGISDNAGNYNEINSLSALYSLNTNATVTTITLCALSALAPSWGLLDPPILESNLEINPLHNLSTTVFFYTPPADIFDKPLDFNLFPKFTWLNSPKVTILSAGNFQLAPTNYAYDNRLSNTQSFWISANKQFSLYNIYYGSFRTFLSAVSSSLTEIEIPVNAEFLSPSGVQVHIQGFNDLVYPNYSLSYVVPENGKLVSKTFQTTATSVSPLLSSVDYKNNPVIVPYSGLPSLSFSLCTLSAALDYNKDVYIDQFIFSSLSSLPIQPINNFGTVTYKLSTTFWQTFVEVPAVSGLIKLISLSIGDSYEPGYVGANSISEIKVIPVEISTSMGINADTFSSYSTAEYLESRNLWKSVTISNSISSVNPQTFLAYTTAVRPQLYISDYITTVNRDFYIVYDTAGESPDNQIISYKTQFDNTGKYIVSRKNEAVYYNFQSPGTFFIQYEIFYSNGQVVTGTFPQPVTVLPNWPTYYQEDIRTLNEDILALPYSLDQVSVQPNEWGEVDIFNTSLIRLHECLEYLKGNSQSINTKFPTSIDGWLGANKNHKDRGISWYTKHFTGQEYLYPYQATLSGQGLAVSEGRSYFTNIANISTLDNYLFVLDNNALRILVNNYYIPEEIIFDNSSDFIQEFISATSICIGENINTLYVCDTPRNKIVRVDLDYENKLFNFSLSVGSFGSLKEPNKFNAPTSISYANNNVYVLDYNNRCVKEFSSDLNWIHTHYSEDFDNDRPLAFAVHTAIHLKDLVYILTENLNLYVFDKKISDPLLIIPLKELKVFLSETYSSLPVSEVIQQLIFEKDGDFLYIKALDYIFKYTLTGFYVGSLKLDFTVNFITPYLNKNILASTSKSIVKMQDVTSLFKIGEGLPTHYWSLDQILLNRDNLADDKSYNRALFRLSQNVKTFRNILNSQFQKFIDSYDKSVYFALVPISKTDQPNLHPDLENDNIKIAVNELHIPQVLNREISKIYKSLIKISEFLNIKEAVNSRTEGSGAYIECPEPFCWSWKATSSGELNLPSVKICGINPITYTELKPDFPLNYAPGKKWKEAVSPCCSEVTTLI